MILSRDPCLDAADAMRAAATSQRAATARVRSVVATMAQRDRDTFLPPQIGRAHV